MKKCKMVLFMVVALAITGGTAKAGMDPFNLNQGVLQPASAVEIDMVRTAAMVSAAHEMVTTLKTRVTELEAKLTVACATVKTATKARPSGASGNVARLRVELAQAKANLAAAKATMGKALADVEVRKDEVKATVDIVKVQVGTVTVVQPSSSANPANPNNPVLLPTVQSDRCKGRMVSATAGAMYTYFECSSGEASSVTESAKKDHSFSSAGKCLLYGVGGMIVGGVGGAAINYGISRARDAERSSWSHDGLIGGLGGAAIGGVLAGGVCAIVEATRE